MTFLVCGGKSNFNLNCYFAGKLSSITRGSQCAGLTNKLTEEMVVGHSKSINWGYECALGGDTNWKNWG